MALEEFRLGDWQVCPKSYELIANGTTIQLKHKPIAVLSDLARHAGEVRTRQELLDAVWSGAHVGDDVLTHCIWELRQALGDDRRSPTYIQTVHGRGYRLIAPVSWQGADASDDARDTVQEPDATHSPDLGFPADSAARLLLPRVERTWIEQALAQSLEGRDPLTVPLGLRPDLVAHPWGKLRPAEAPAPGEAELTAEPLLASFERLQRAVLLLGDAGSGKTVALLRLAEQALERARQTPSEPVPVILHLASWKDRSQPFEAWIADEIHSRYYLPRADVHDWISSNRLLLLLDGLDEVEASRRQHCVRAFNRFREAMPLTAVAITCRLTEYEALQASGAALLMAHAVELQPLTQQAVRSSLSDAPDVEDTLSRDAELDQLARSPLMLAIIRRIVERAPEQLREVSEGAADGGSRRAQLLYAYIRSCLRTSGAFPPYSERQTVSWLSALATDLNRHDRAVLQTEELQPSWLQGRRWRLAYVGVTRMTAGLLLGLTQAWLVILLGTTAAVVLQKFVLGAAGGATVALIDLLLMRGASSPAQGSRWPGPLRRLAYSLGIGGAFGVTAYAVCQAFSPGRALAEGVIFGLCAALVLRRDPAEIRMGSDIRTFESLTWSWRKALMGWLRASGLLYLLLVVTGWLAGRLSGDPGEFLKLIINALFLGGIPALLLGVQRGWVDGKTRPNHGIWLSVRSMLLGAGLVTIGTLVSTVAFLGLLRTGLLGPLVFLEAFDLVPDPKLLLTLGSTMVLLSALWFGGYEVLKHYALRLLLALQGRLPAALPRFLDYAARRALLRKAGAGYLFFHPALRSYFATIGGTDESSDEMPD
ncbi:MAG: winged helix-turn-helix domain-containing protein [Acidobacteriota bacterium]